MNIYVGNLAYEVGDEDLRSLFSEHGEVVSAKVITDMYTGKSKGFGFVEMKSKPDGQKAIESLNGMQLKNREIVVNEARPREERGGGGGGGGRRHSGGGGGGGGGGFRSGGRSKSGGGQRGW